MNHTTGADLIISSPRIIGADETQIKASFCEAVRIAKEQKSVSLKKRAEET